MAQTPTLQIAVPVPAAGVGQTLPQPPQLFVLLQISVSQPFAAFASQLRRLGLLHCTPHTPFVHCATDADEPLPPAGQTAQFGPHWFGLLRVSTHEPPAVQYANPGLQQRPSVEEPGRMLQASPEQH